MGAKSRPKRCPTLRGMTLARVKVLADTFLIVLAIEAEQRDSMIGQDFTNSFIGDTPTAIACKVDSQSYFV